MKAIIWSRDNCTYCSQAKALMMENKIEFEERKIGEGWTKDDLLQVVPTAKTVPQIFINDELVGGFTELKKRLYNVN